MNDMSKYNQANTSKMGCELLIASTNADVAVNGLVADNRLSLEPMLFGWGVFSPAAFIASAHARQTKMASSYRAQVKHSIQSTLLSLEPMLFGWGILSPAAFIGSQAKAQAVGKVH